MVYLFWADQHLIKAWDLNFCSFTGDVAFRILETIKSVKRRALQDILDDNVIEETQIYVCDINPNMLDVGKKRAQERGKVCSSLVIKENALTL